MEKPEEKDVPPAFFSHSDWLGTERVRMLYSNPNIPTKCVSLPFGDGFSCYGGDWSPLHFTGKEHDYESGLDDFGARYMGSSLGRFMSPDPENAGAVNADPQSWNGYSYVRNNPVNLTDPTGRIFCRPALYGGDGGVQTSLVCDVTDEQYNKNPGVYLDYQHYDCGDECDDRSNLATQQADQGQNKPDPNTTTVVTPDFGDMLFDAVGQGTQMARPGVNAAIGVTAPQLIFMGGASIALSGAGSTLILQGSSELTIQTIQMLMASTPEEAEALVQRLATTPEGRALLRAVEEQLDTSMGKMSPQFGNHAALRAFQYLHSIIEPLIHGGM